VQDRGLGGQAGHIGLGEEDRREMELVRSGAGRCCGTRWTEASCLPSQSYYLWNKILDILPALFIAF
jgi:hypothetical protein